MTVGACVVDASVAAMLFLPERLSGHAEFLFAGLQAEVPARLHVPDLFYVEVAHVLLKHVRRDAYPAEAAVNDLEKLIALALRPTSTGSLTRDAFALAHRYGLSAYDACYVALSDQVKAPLVTADQRLVRALGGTPYRVHWLGDIRVE